MNRLSGLFHKNIEFLWNRPESLFLRMVQDMSSNQFAPRLLRQTVWKKGRSHPANPSNLNRR
ncbi:MULTISPECIES: hypothetical protein [unclassified Microcoleus]|uniref:hypothetical protein n=1 Tax=unclassified Microcoleus TaxID=2642155 RepID=UPI002FD09126